MGVVDEFKQFLLRGNVIDLAVAIVIGTAFTVVVNSLVKDIFTPLIAAVFGEPNFAALSFTINGSHFTYGNFLNALFTFVTVALAIFFLVVKPYNMYLERRRAGRDPEPAAKSEEVLVLEEIRDLLRTTDR
jgi:large conductance mechanosensitive channel